MTQQTEILFTDLINKVWGNLKTEDERIGWCNIQKPLAEADFNKYRREYIEMDLPHIICSHLYRQSENLEEFKSKVVNQAEWVKFFQLEKEFNEAYQRVRKENK